MQRLRSVKHMLSQLAVRSNIEEKSTHDSLTTMTDGELMGRLYNFVRSRQIEGTLLLDRSVGTYGISSLRILRGWGTISEAEWPYLKNGDPWPPSEPRGLDESAKKLRIGPYQRVRNFGDCKILLRRGVATIVCIRITDQWFANVKGEIEMPDSGGLAKIGHAVLIDGYDDVNSKFRFRNSWGGNWGDSGYGYMPYEYFDQFLIEAWAISPVGVKLTPTSDKFEGVISTLFKSPDFLSRAQTGDDNPASFEDLHSFEIFDLKYDERLGWASAICREGILEVEELYVRPNFRRRSYGSKLVEMIREKAEKLRVPICLWVPHADVLNVENVQTIEHLSKKLD